MERKRKLRTLNIKDGKAYFEEPEEIIFETTDFSEIAKKFLDAMKNKKTSLRSKQSNYVTYEEFNRLQIQVTQLRQAIKKTRVIPHPSEIKEAQENVVSALKSMNEIRQVYLNIKNKSITFFIIVDCYSKDLLHKIAEIEISISRKHPLLSIELEPILSINCVQEGSILVVNKT